jgi:hypothetical protein
MNLDLVSRFGPGWMEIRAEKFCLEVLYVDNHGSHLLDQVIHA